MEEPKNENEVTLVLRDCRITARKDMLARKSLYFAALFSTNFSDHQQKEIDINYDISLITLQTFVDWVNNEDEHGSFIYSSKYHFYVRVSLVQFLEGSHLELLELLNFSAFVLAEKLIDDITEIIVCTRLHPNLMSKVWLLAEDLQLKVLGDIAFASCLDRFEDLSLSCLLKLSKKNFFRLVLNANVNGSPDHMVFVIEEWKKNNGLIDPIVEDRKELGQEDNVEVGKTEAAALSFRIDIFYCYFEHEGSTKVPTDPDKILASDLKSVKRFYESSTPCYMACAAGRESGDSIFVRAWNRVTHKIEEMAKFTTSQMHRMPGDYGYEIVGRQVIGRAFSIYVIGGEFGLHTNRFNTTLWRYCLLSKKWYIETILPRPRKHMGVAFLKNKLYLFGGVGHWQLELSSVDVYDIHAGTWSQAADIPVTFTEVPVSFVANGNIHYKKSAIYVYKPTSDEWKRWRVPEITNLPIRSILPGMFRIPSIPGSKTHTERRLLLLYSAEKYRIPLCEYPRSGVRENPRIGLREYPRIGLGLIEHFERDRTKELAEFEIAWDVQDEPNTIYQEVWDEPWLVSFGSAKSGAYVAAQHLFVLFADRASKTPNKLRLQVGSRATEFRERLTNVPADCFGYRLGSFKIIDPQTLHQSMDGYLLELCSGPQWGDTCANH